MNFRTFALFASFLVLTILNASAQHLSFKDLLSLYKKNKEEQRVMLNSLDFKSMNWGTEDFRELSYWKFKDSNNKPFPFGEYLGLEHVMLIQDCISLRYLFIDETHFNRLEDEIKKSNSDYLFSENSTEGAKINIYLVEGSIEVKFASAPSGSPDLSEKVFAILIKRRSSS